MLSGTSSQERPEPPSDLLPILDRGKPILGYYGALAQWVDFPLLSAVARERPDWSLVLIGPDHDGAMGRSELIENHENVFWLGPKPYGRLPRYLAWFDVAAIPFAVNRVTESVSPVKLFEYMAGGKPVISADLSECRSLPGVYLASNAGKFLEALDQAYANRANPEYLARLDQHARENTWDVRARLLLSHVFSDPDRL